MRAHEQVVADLKRVSYGKWKSQVEKFLYGLCDMKLKDFQDYNYKADFDSGLDPRQSSLKLLETYGTKMEFEKI